MAALVLGALAVASAGGCAGPEPAAETASTRREDAVLALRAGVGPLREGQAPTQRELPDVVVFADGLVVARDRRVLPGDARYPAFVAARLSPQELPDVRRRLEGSGLEELPPRVEGRSFGAEDANDTVVRVAQGEHLVEVRAYALNTRVPLADRPDAFPAGLQDVDRLLHELADAANASGETWTPDGARPLPTVPGGPVLGG